MLSPTDAWLMELHDQAALRTVLDTNRLANRYGLSLSLPEARELVQARNRLLLDLGRAEFGAEGLAKLALSFCSSPYIDQEDYLTTLVDLLEVFYCLKNATEDAIGDDDLIAGMRRFFDGADGGCVELLLDHPSSDYLQAGAPESLGGEGSSHR